MMFKSIISNKILLAFLLVSLIIPSISGLTVSIQPKNGVSPATAYSYEIVDYIIKVRNDVDAEITDVGLKVLVDPNLKIVEGYDELEYKLFKLPVMGPKELREEEVKIKPTISAKDAAGKKLQITVDYGISSLTDYAGTYLLVTEPSLVIDSKLSSEKISTGEDAFILLNLSNQSDSDISNISFELIGNEDFFIKETSFFNIAVLKQKESIAEKQLEFKLTNAKKSQNLIMETTFVDSIGEHVLQKNFAIKELPKTMTYVYLLIVLVLALIVFTLFKIMKNKNSPPKKESHSGQSSASKSAVVHGAPVQHKDSEEQLDESEEDLDEEESEPESEEDLDEESEPEFEEESNNSGHKSAGHP